MHRPLVVLEALLHQAKVAHQKLEPVTQHRRLLVVDLGDEAARELPGASRQVVSLHGRRPVFCTRKGTPLTLWGFQSMWRRTREKVPSAADLTFHDLRAWAISMREKDKAAFAGHSDPTSTQRVYQRLPVRLKPGR